MKNLVFSIRRSDVFNEVALNSAYRLLHGREAADSVSEFGCLRESDQRMANWLFDDAVASLLTSLRPFAHGVVNSLSLFSVTLALQDDWPSDLLHPLQAHIKAFLVNTILAKWLDLAGKPDCAATAQVAARELSDLLALIYHRQPPTRPRP